MKKDLTYKEIAFAVRDLRVRLEETEDLVPIIQKTLAELLKEAQEISATLAKK
jgi:hypothetical protein